MGTATDGVLAYGYDLGGDDYWYDESPDWYDDTDDFAGQAMAELRRAAGFAETYEDGKPNYYQREREADAALRVEIVTHCSDSAPMYLLATKVITVYRGDVEEIDLDGLRQETLGSGWDERLAAALVTLGLTPKQAKPGWMLVSYWGA